MSWTDAFAERAEAALSPAQHRVLAELGRGPVKVAAAAGSGKTTTMAWLYAAGVASQLGLGQIMAVTFTERAAAELRRKVAQVLLEVGAPLGEAEATPLEGAWIGTFHQLIRRLLSEHAYLAGLPRDLELVDEVRAQVVMRQALAAVRGRSLEEGAWLAELPADADLRDVARLPEAAAQAVRALRATALSPREVARRSLAAHAQAAAAGDSPAELAWHRAALALTTAVWREYDQRLAADGALDFDGLLREGLAALRRSPRLLGWCRSRFRLVIVDEYQDTSALQESLILELTGPEHRSLFMVGDARQSIYAFRDAKPAIMAEAPGLALPLFRNHRSRELVLRAADHVIRAEPEFAADEPMEAARTESPLPVYLAEVEETSQEAEAIASALERLHREGIAYPDGSREAVHWREMAVLAFTLRRLGPLLEEALRRRGIPFQTATGGLLDRPEVRDLLAYLRLARDDRDDLACLRVLQSRLVRLPDRALLSLRTSAGSGRPSLAERLRAHLERGAPGWEPAWVLRARRTLALLERLRRRSQLGSGEAVVQEALTATGLLALQEAGERAGAAEGRRGGAALRELQRLCWEASPVGFPLDLGELLERLELMQDEAQTAEPPAQTDEDLVTLSTIHRAKGLEWQVVVLADCRPPRARGAPRVFWDADAEGVFCSRMAGAETAALVRWRTTPAAQVERAERRRLIYVAMTRAKDLLLVTTTNRGRAGEFWELAEAAVGGAAFVRVWPDFGGAGDPPWAGGASSEPRELGAASRPGRVPPTAQLVRRWQQLAELTPPREGGSRPPIQLSFSSIEMLQHCPRQFWYRYLAGFPDQDGLAPAAADQAGADGRAAALRLGVGVHEALEWLHAGPAERLGLADSAGAALAEVRSSLEPGERLEAERLLIRYLTLPSARLPTVATEYEFRWSDWAGPGCPPLVGVIDRIARLPSGELLLIDYKTNRELGKEELADYSRQLQLYAAAVAAGALGGKVAAPRAALLMLRTGELIPVTSGAGERQAAVEWALRAAARVSAGDYRAAGFPERPCSGCAFAPRCPERRVELASGLSRGA